MDRRRRGISGIDFDDYVEIVETKGKRRKITKQIIRQDAEPPAPEIPTIEPLFEALFDDFGEGYEPHGRPKQRSTDSQHTMLAKWVQKLPEYIAALLYHESPTATINSCCGSGKMATFSCIECIPSPLICASCMVESHTRSPFHRIKSWNGTFFERSSLHDLGLVVSVRHDNAPCPTPASDSVCTAVHTNGLHSCTVRLCGCDGAETPDIQLFKMRLFPATTQRPKTVFSFELLRQFRLHHLEGKASAYSFMQALQRMTDNTATIEVQDRLREFQRVARQWNFLHALKYSGRYGSSSAETLAVSCPACPHPNVNLPTDWFEMTPKDRHWLAQLFLHFDANFRLALERKKSKAAGDRTLWGGLGYFVEQGGYNAYLEVADGTQQEPSECVDHKAVAQKLRSRFNTLEVTGIAGGVCRHDCAVPNMFVDLYKGERYVNSDYAISTGLSKVKGLQDVVLSYDIACQYSRKFQQRFAKSHLLSTPAFSITFLCPKFHLSVHKEECRHYYSFNYRKNVGRTEGEGIERFWSPHDHLSGSTTKMTAGFRTDTLEIHFADWNWRKSIEMGGQLRSKLERARKQLSIHVDHFDELCESLEADDVTNWTKIEDEFIPQLGAQSIYQAAADNIPTQSRILLELLTAENMDSFASTQHRSDGTEFGVAHWINEGLAIEESQRLLHAKSRVIDSSATEKQQSELLHSKQLLRSRISAWRLANPLDVTGITVPGEMDNDSDEDDFVTVPIQPELEPLLLPSKAIDVEFSPFLKETEYKLRVGQAHDAIKATRTALSQRVALLRVKKKSARGTKQNTRAHTIVNRATAQVNMAAERYRAARTALLALGMKDDDPTFLPLNSSDLSTSSVFDQDRAPGRGTEQLSWIWRVKGSGLPVDDVEVDDWLREVVRVQFLDSKVNRDRWREEVELLEVELQRTAAYFEYKSKKWGAKSADAVSDGERAHSARMAAQFQRMADRVVMGDVIM